jgi:PIN domain nuclease of toxin-antitoxin system
LFAGGFMHVHPDPFDRMLAAHGLIEDALVLSDDAELRALGCESLGD